MDIGFLIDKKWQLVFFFFFDNHREYIEKAIKRIAKEKYKRLKKKKN